jgi:predicted phosphoribosyltransferase/predicted alpha/beta-hydrolase family hydrolase
MAPFNDRVDAGRQLAQRLQSLRGQDVVVLGLPRGGVPVAFEVAKALRAPLDILVVRKLGVPFQPELAFGAIGEGGEVRVINDVVVREAHLSRDDMDAAEKEQRTELQRRSDRFRGGRGRISLTGRIALVIDDGIATGATAKAACQIARAQGASRVVLAVPIGPDDIVARFATYADEVVCLQTPAFFFAVGQGYRTFTQTTDDEVVALLDRAREGFLETAPSAVADPPLRDEEVQVAAGPVTVAGHLTVPEHPRGIVVFAHGSGSSRYSPRNRYVAGVLNRAGLATLLFDLLTPAEERNRANVFDIELLAGRLVDVTGWLASQRDTASLPVGYFCANTGAGAALVAAADPRVKVGAVVSRGGRPDLAGRYLADVDAPTLLIVGGLDEVVLQLNRRAQAAIPGKCELIVVPGATHLFEEPGTLEKVAVLGRDWFVDHLSHVVANP